MLPEPSLKIPWKIVAQWLHPSSCTSFSINLPQTKCFELQRIKSKFLNRSFLCQTRGGFGLQRRGSLQSSSFPYHIVPSFLSLRFVFCSSPSQNPAFFTGGQSFILQFLTVFCKSETFTFWPNDRVSLLLQSVGGIASSIVVSFRFQFSFLNMEKWGLFHHQRPWGLSIRDHLICHT